MVQTLTETLIERGLTDRVLSERQLDQAIGGPATRRYGLVNRALRPGNSSASGGAFISCRPNTAPNRRTPSPSLRR